MTPIQGIVDFKLELKSQDLDLSKFSTRRRVAVLCKANEGFKGIVRKRVSYERGVAMATVGFEALQDYVSPGLSWSGLGLSSPQHASCPRMAMAMTMKM